ncbi:MAG: histidine phosphatase family protein [Victivallaceae bacterium]|nr:histidine phosphatase family protein [Victivallaceae bacterium]
MAERIIFIRHGSLPAEHSSELIGVCDVPLSGQGRAEAAAAGRWLMKECGDCDAVYAGTLRRVGETLAAAREYAQYLPEEKLDPRLNEMDFGDWSFTPARLHPPESWRCGDPEYAFPNGERMGDFMTRTRSFLKELTSSGANNPVVFSHGGVIMALLADLIGLERSHQFNIWVSRGAVAEVDMISGRPRLRRIFRPLDFFG